MLWIYDHESKEMVQCESGKLPYLKWSNLQKEEFAGKKALLSWTDRRFLERYDRLCRLFGEAIPVSSAFHRLMDRSHKGQSLHYAGLAMDIGKNYDSEKLEELRKLALKHGEFTYVEPVHMAPTWVHVEFSPVSSTGRHLGYPDIEKDTQGVFVLVLQETLRLLDFYHDALSGRVNRSTLQGLEGFLEEKLTDEKIVTTNTWRKLFKALSKKKIDKTLSDPFLQDASVKQGLFD